jgi:hypothetical protein
MSMAAEVEKGVEDGLEREGNRFAWWAVVVSQEPA